MTMKLTGTYNGKPIELELTEEQVEVLKQREKKKTGWERVEKGERYFINAIRVAQQEEKAGSSSDDTYYKNASYFANKHSSDIFSQHNSSSANCGAGVQSCVRK